MPVIFHESKRRLGNAGKDRPYSRIPPKPVWPGLDHNGKPVGEEATQDLPPMEMEPKDQPTAAPACRSRKRKKTMPSVWKEIMTVSEEQLPSDLQAADSSKELTTPPEATEIPTEPTSTLNCQDGDSLPLPIVTPVDPVTVPTTDPSPPESNPVLQCIPDMISGLSDLQSKMDSLLSLHSMLSEKQEESSQALKSHEAILSRMEAFLSRQETHHSQRVINLHKRIHELEQEARRRDMVIMELQKAQKQERRESQNRITEALQRIEQLQAQNEKLQRQTLSKQEKHPLPRKVGDANFIHDVNLTKKRRLDSQNSICDSTETSDGFDTPAKQEQKREPLLNDSPSSIGSFSSSKAFSRRQRIIPGRSLLRSTDSRRVPSIRDLIPNYSLDSLARGRSQSST